MSFASNLRTLLSERNIKLTQLCRDTGLSYNTIQSILKRDTDAGLISVNTVDTIAKYLNIPIERLIDGDLPEQPEEIRLTAEEWEYIKKYRAAPPEIKKAIRRIVDED